MLISGLIERLHQMKLLGMAKALEDIEAGDHADLGFEDRLSLMVDQEEAARRTRALTRRLQAAKLRFPQAAVEDVDFRRKRNLNRTSFLALAQCEWIRSGYNLLITGPTGIGKTYLACALGRRACREGYSVRYLRLPRLFETLSAAHGDGTFLRVLERLGKVQLMILDEYGLYSHTSDQRRYLAELIEERAERHSTIMLSQLKVKEWHNALGEGTIADSILDRLVSAAYRIELEGKSVRDSKRPPELGS